MKIPLSYKPQNEVVLHAKLRFDSKLTSGEKLFLAEVASICKTDKCYYEQKALSELFQVSRMTIATWVKNLVSLGYLQIYYDSNDPKCKQLLKPI